MQPQQGLVGVCLSSLVGKGISAVSNDEPLVSMILAQCNTQTVNTYLSLGQLNALYVREY